MCPQLWALEPFLARSKRFSNSDVCCHVQLLSHDQLLTSLVAGLQRPHLVDRDAAPQLKPDSDCAHASTHNMWNCLTHCSFVLTERGRGVRGSRKLLVLARYREATVHQGCRTTLGWPALEVSGWRAHERDACIKFVYTPRHAKKPVKT